MTDRDETKRKTELRARAEARLLALRAEKRSQPPSPEDALLLVHELEVHQIELELQNEELRRAHGELERLHARYFDLYDLAPVGYFALSEAGLIEEANLAAETLLGVERGGLLRQPFARFVAAQDQDSFSLHRRALSTVRAPQTCELRFVKHDGEVWARLHSCVREGEAGWRVAAIDLTQVRALEAQLAQADRLATLGMLAAGVAHELNNPLTYVLHNLTALAEDLMLDAAAVRAVPAGEISALSAKAQDALDGTRRIHRISKLLGTFARTNVLEHQATDVNEAIESAIAMAASEIDEHAVLVRELDEAVPKVAATSAKLAQIFLNLLLNATSAIAPNDAANQRITVRSWSENGSVLVSVTDTGAGISAANARRVFEPFFTTKPVGRSVGLGLSIAQSLTEEFGGSIHLERQLDRGVRFVVRLPAFEVASADPAHPSAVPTRSRILVIDDDAMVRGVIKRVLKDHDVVLADDGTQALEILARDPAFDLILCDVMMPKITGIEVHARLVAEHPDLAARMIFVSGGAFGENVQAYLSRINSLVVAKPFVASELQQLVADQLARRKH